MQHCTLVITEMVAEVFYEFEKKEMCFFQVETYSSVKRSFLLTIYRFVGCKTLLQIPKF